MVQAQLKRVYEDDGVGSENEVAAIIDQLVEAGEPIELSKLAQEVGRSVADINPVLLQLHYYNITAPSTMGEERYIGFHPGGMSAVRRALEKHQIRTAAISNRSDSSHG